MSQATTSALLSEAAGRLQDAIDCTAVSIEDIADYGLLLSVRYELEQAAKYVAGGIDTEIDGPSGLAGGETALTEASELIAQAADAETGPAIEQCQGHIAQGQEHANEARTLLAAITQKREELAGQIAAAKEAVDALIELETNAVERIGEVCNAADAAHEQATVIAEKLQAAVA